MRHLRGPEVAFIDTDENLMRLCILAQFVRIHTLPHELDRLLPVLEPGVVERELAEFAHLQPAT